MKKMLCALLSAILIVSMVCLPGCSADKPGKDQPMDVVRVATTPHIASAAIWAADQLGYFADENIQIETTSFSAMAPAISAMAVCK